MTPPQTLEQILNEMSDERLYYNPQRNILIVFSNGIYGATLTANKKKRVSFRKLVRFGPQAMGFECVGEL